MYGLFIDYQKIINLPNHVPIIAEYMVMSLVVLQSKRNNGNMKCIQGWHVSDKMVNTTIDTAVFTVSSEIPF